MPLTRFVGRDWFSFVQPIEPPLGLCWFLNLAGRRWMRLSGKVFLHLASYVSPFLSASFALCKIVWDEFACSKFWKGSVGAKGQKVTATRICSECGFQPRLCLPAPCIFAKLCAEIPNLEILKLFLPNSKYTVRIFLLLIFRHSS
jgi:hypothetical protein